MANEQRFVKTGDLPLMTTTLWDYPSRNYPGKAQGDDEYLGSTPSYVIANLLERYTKPKWLVVDPMAGSGTTLDVARDMDRRALGYDLQPSRKDIFRVDARKLPLETAKVDFVFIDPPYSNHVKYSGLPECIGELDARANNDYYDAMERVFTEIHRILKPDRHMALYVSDSAKKGKSFVPLGFELLHRLRKRFSVVDIVAVVRHNQTLKRNHWHTSAAEGNYYLRGFNYLFIMKKVKEVPVGRAKGVAQGKPKSTGSRGAASRKSGSKTGSTGPKSRSAGPKSRGSGSTTRGTGSKRSGGPAGGKGVRRSSGPKKKRG